MASPYIQPSKSAEWQTPRDLFDKLWDEVGGFDLDPFCHFEHYTAQRVLANGGTIYVPYDDQFALSRDLGGRGTIGYDGLERSWKGRAAYMNAPYGWFLNRAVPKAVAEVDSGRMGAVWALLPAKTDTAWWQKYVAKYAVGWDVSLLDKLGSAAPQRHVPMRRADAVWFVDGRLHFTKEDGTSGPAGFASALVVWKAS